MTVKDFLIPTKRKIVLFFIISAALLIVTVILFIINELDIAVVFLYPLSTLPITLFDAVTGGAFRSGACSFLCFPTLPQISFIFLFDIVAIFLLSCTIAAVLKKQPPQTPPAGRLPAGRQGPPSDSVS